MSILSRAGGDVAPGSGNEGAEDAGVAQTLGALLRLSYQQFARRTLAGAVAAGFPGVRGAHTTVLQPLFFNPQGLTAVDLAGRAGITKQVMGRLIDQLEAQGYVERAPHPLDRRARLVRLTAQGHAAATAIRAAAAQIEAACGERLGGERLADLRQLLEELGDILGAETRSIPFSEAASEDDELDENASP